jgi:hypothetical protein
MFVEDETQRKQEPLFFHAASRESFWTEFPKKGYKNCAPSGRACIADWFFMQA